MLDEYLIGSATRISPEAPVPVIAVTTRTEAGGGAANVAVNIRSLGGHASVVGVIGDDLAGGRLRTVLNSWGISLEGVLNSGSRATICKTRIVAGQQQIVRLDHEDLGPMPDKLQRELMVRAVACLPHHDVCVFSDYGKGVLSEDVCRSVLNEATALGKTVIVDPKGRNFSKYRSCALISPNLLEAATAVGIPVEEEQSVLEAGRRLLAMLPGSRVLITRGADGMTFFSSEGEPITFPALARKVFNVVGAGDTVVSTLALAEAIGLSTEIAIRLATITAGIVVGKPGTATVTVDDLMALETNDYTGRSPEPPMDDSGQIGANYPKQSS